MIRTVAAIVAAGLAGAACWTAPPFARAAMAAVEAGAAVPLPRPRPQLHAGEAGDAAVPLPRPRPADDDDVAPVAMVPLPLPRPEAEVPAPRRSRESLPRLAAHEHGACMRRLAEAGIETETLPPISDEPCGMRWPLSVAEVTVADTPVSLAPAATVRCPVVEALAVWMEEAVQPAAERHLGGTVTGLRVSGSYVCRTRNHASGAPLSEHAVGNAIDIAAFATGDDGWLEVSPREDDDAPEAQFLSEVREAACTHFHTVLGPGSDPFHTDHFHLDLARRGADGTSRYCR